MRPYFCSTKNKNLSYSQGAVFISSYNLQDRNCATIFTLSAMVPRPIQTWYCIYMTAMMQVSVWLVLAPVFKETSMLRPLATENGTSPTIGNMTAQDKSWFDNWVVTTTSLYITNLFSINLKTQNKQDFDSADIILSRNRILSLFWRVRIFRITFCS